MFPILKMAKIQKYLYNYLEWILTNFQKNFVGVWTQNPGGYSENEKW